MADVARTVLLLNNAHCHSTDSLPQRENRSGPCQALQERIPDTYFKMAGGGLDLRTAASIVRVDYPVAAVRLDENIVQEKALCLQTVRKGPLGSSVPLTDSLVFGIVISRGF